MQDDDITATARYSESLELFRNLGDNIGTASILHNQAYLGLHQNNTTQAEALLMESLTLSHEFMNTGQIAYDLAGLGGVPAAHGQPHRAAQLLAAADAWFIASGDMPTSHEQAEHDSYGIVARTQLGEEAFAAA